MGLYEVIIESGADSILLPEILASQGLPREKIVEIENKKKKYISIFVSSLKDAKKIKRVVTRLRIKGLKVRSRSLKNENWRDKWKKDYKPFRYVGEFSVVPAWLKNKYPANKSIFIDTTVAFGTGLHETTKLIGKLIYQRKGKFNSFLDIGTGTGILAVLAHKCGANNISGIDLTKEVIDIARENFNLNKVGVSNLKVKDINKNSCTVKYDFVAANLNTLDLTKLRLKIISCLALGGYLAVSGVSLEKVAEYKEGFQDKRLKLIKTLKGKEWAAFLYKKNA